MIRIFLIFFFLGAWFQPALAQDNLSSASADDVPTLSLADAAAQEQCITILTGFPDANYQERYQFFRLVQLMGVDSTPDFRRALLAFSDGPVPADTPITDVIDVISNPVIRQAAPEIAISNMGHLIEFSKTCEAFIKGQTDSLSIYDSGLNEVSFNQVIAEDALFLRQVLVDTLYRQNADTDAVHAEPVIAYARSLVLARNDIEFAGFDSEVDELEAIFLSDLDGRLARSNDLINNEINTESIASAITLSRDLNKSAAEKATRERQIELLRIFRIFQ